MVKNDIKGTINKTAIKNFAVYSRNKLIQDIKNKAALIGITESGIQEPLSSSTGNIQLFEIGTQEPYRIEGKAIEQRNDLIKELKTREEDSAYDIAYETLVEEVAYTWFNRIIAIRFMEVNNYMPDRMRVLSSGVEGINEPEFITQMFETNFNFTNEERERIISLKTNGSNLAMDELFQFLFIKQCNALNENLPELFEKTNDYSELLLTVSYNDVDGIIYKLIHEISESDFDVNSESGHGQVEIIGWLYQYYNIEPKIVVFNRPKSKKIEKQDIPAATQLFTPEWIVKYMVENTLGRVWIEKLKANDDTCIEKEIAKNFNWKYYVPEAAQDKIVTTQLIDIQKGNKDISIEDIKFLDPAMGSFHIGIYAFEVFMQIYKSEGYTTREAARLILEKNLHGLDIDKRASQLSYFTCMMQARKYNRQILNNSLLPKVYEVRESNHINIEHLNYLGNNIADNKIRDALKMQIIFLLNNFKNAKEYGSLIDIDGQFDFGQLKDFVKANKLDTQISLLDTVGLEETQKEILHLINVAEVMATKYEVIVTNPPYMGLNGMDKILSEYVKKNYPSSKSDLFSCFIEKALKMLKRNGYTGLMTSYTWMFLNNYIEIRRKIIKTATIYSLIQPEYHSFFQEAFVPICIFILRKCNLNYSGKYIRLENFTGAEQQKIKTLEAISNDNCDYCYEIKQTEFNKLPGLQIAYWLNQNTIDLFKDQKYLNEFAEMKQGLITGDNDKFLRYWFECDENKITTDISQPHKWFFYHKGGEYRKWYGNINLVVNWEKDGDQIINFRDDNGKLRSRPQNVKYYFKEGFTWTSLTISDLSVRLMPEGAIFDAKGSSGFVEHKEDLLYIIALMNSKPTMVFLEILSPTMDYGTGALAQIPTIIDSTFKKRIEEITLDCIQIAKEDWDSHEKSFEYRAHPFVAFKEEIALDKTENTSRRTLEMAYENWKKITKLRFTKLKNNEEELNKIFINMYDLGGFILPHVDDKNISVRQADIKYDIRSFISYVVGCIFGRYSLDREGIVFAGGDFDINKYSTFLPEESNIILISEQEYFSYDIVNRFIEFIRMCYGDNTLEENLLFIAKALNSNGKTSREILRDYFLKDFYKDHIKMYQKCPIYWLYDSGKQNGFKALVYMHRYAKDTTGKVRVDYLHQVQKAYERTIANLQEEMANSNDAKEITQIQKRIEKLTKQLKECKEYDERLGHIALERIPIDLDNGVKVNYQKVQTDSKGKVHQVLAKIK